LDRQQVGDVGVKKGGKPGVGSKRLRTQAEDREEGRTYEWRWGPRAFCEVGEEYIGKFIAEFMVSSEVDQEEEGRAAATSAAARAKEKALVEKMYVGVEKAAGGKLMGLK
jgi:melanoma-associated antigen